LGFDSHLFGINRYLKTHTKCLHTPMQRGQKRNWIKYIHCHVHFWPLVPAPNLPSWVPLLHVPFMWVVLLPAIAFVFSLFYTPKRFVYFWTLCGVKVLQEREMFIFPICQKVLDLLCLRTLGYFLYTYRECVPTRCPNFHQVFPLYLLSLVLSYTPLIWYWNLNWTPWERSLPDQLKISVH
jgi:hypothetical protein